LIGLIIITHGNLAIELKSSLENIIGPQKDLETVCIGYDDDVDKRKEEVKELISKVDSGNGVILLTEMFGNTPSNLLISLIDENKIEMIGGINLPLLVKQVHHKLKDLLKLSVRQKLNKKACLTKIEITRCL